MTGPGFCQSVLMFGSGYGNQCCALAPDFSRRKSPALGVLGREDEVIVSVLETAQC